MQENYKWTYLYAGIDVIQIATPSGTIELAVHITPLVKPGVIASADRPGAYVVRPLCERAGRQSLGLPGRRVRAQHPVRARKTEKQYKLVTPLGKSDMMGRSIIEAMSVEQLANGIKPAIELEQEEDTPKLPYEMYDRLAYAGHKWGMTIDVNSCTGCSACVAACYAENNFPLVGKEKVDKGRMMSWIRVERFIPRAGGGGIGAEPLYRADALPAVRPCAVRAGLPGLRFPSYARRTQRADLQSLHRHALLRKQLPLQGAAFQLVLSGMARAAESAA